MYCKYFKQNIGVAVEKLLKSLFRISEKAFLITENGRFFDNKPHLQSHIQRGEGVSTLNA
jgi:hypothetical protein